MSVPYVEKAPRSGHSKPDQFSESCPKTALTYASFDKPQHSRIFFLLRKNVKLEEIKKHFSAFGSIEEFWVQRKKHCNVYFGAAFVKYALSSQAFRAVEATRSLLSGFSQVYLARSRVSGKRAFPDLKLPVQIRVKVPKSFNETKLRDEFKVYGEITLCLIITNNIVGESNNVAYLTFSKASQAALAIEECDKSYQAVWSDTRSDLSKSSEHESCVSGVKQKTTNHEVQGANLNTLCKSTNLKEIVIEPSKLSHVNSPRHEPTDHEVQESSLNTLDKPTSLDEPVAKLTAPAERKTLPISTEKETTNNEVRGSLIPTVSRTTLFEPVTKTSESVSGTEQKSNIHRVQGSNLIILGSKPPESQKDKLHIKANRKAQREHKNNWITLASADNTASSKPAANSSKSNVNTVKRSNFTLGYNTSESEPVSKPPEHYGNEYNVGSTSYSFISPGSLTAPPGSNTYYYNASSVGQQTNDNRIQESNLITSGYNTVLSAPVYAQSMYMQPEYYNYYQYYGGSTGYGTTLTVSVTKPPETDVYWSYVNSAVQEPNAQKTGGDSLTTLGYNTASSESVTKPLGSSVQHFNVSDAKPEANNPEVQQSTVLTSDKSLKSSECKFYLGGTRQKKRSHKVHGSSLLTSVNPPDLANVERNNTRRQESISKRLLMVSEFPLAQKQIFGLFDVIPGLESCEARSGLYSNHVYAMIQYKNIASAVYAKCRLHGLEYPLGNRLHVKFTEGGTDGTDLIQEMATQLVTSQLASMVWDKNWAPQLLRPSESRTPSSLLQTDAELPLCKRKAPSDASVRERLFILFDPRPLPQDVLDNVLSRFGNFIKSTIIPGENVAYATFAERASASDTIAVLHGKTVNGVKLKVVLADLPTEDFNKRQRMF